MNIGKQVGEVLASKVKFKRAMIAIITILIILGLFGFLILTDQTCDWKNKIYGTKSKVDVDIKKGQ